MRQDNPPHIEPSHTIEYEKRIVFESVPLNTDALYTQLWQRIENEKIISIGISPKWKYLSIAASIALLIVSSLLVSVYTRPKELTYVEVAAISGSKVKVMLPDSSVVWLNSNARIRYPQQFLADCRTVEFTGEALFQVRKNPQAPFQVNADGLRIQVLGTEFNVYANPESHLIETTLLNGSVALFGSQNRTKEADKILLPNQQALYDKRNGQIEVLQVHALSYASWVSGQFIFEKNTLEEIVTALQRAFDMKIHIESESLKKERLTARFIHQETLDEILSILQISAHYNYRKEKGQIYIFKN